MPTVVTVVMIFQAEGVASARTRCVRETESGFETLGGLERMMITENVLR